MALAAKLNSSGSEASGPPGSVSVSTASHSEDSSLNNSTTGSEDFLSAVSGDVLSISEGTEVKVAEFSSLKNAIKLLNLEAIKAEEVYKAENSLLAKANEQLMKFSSLLQEQDAELAATEEALNKERKQRESAEKHYIKLKKMMVVKDVEVSEAEQRKKSEILLRKGAEKEMSLLRKQVQAKEASVQSAERKYQKECKKREKFESQMLELSKKAGKQSAEEKYQMLQRLREKDDDNESTTSLSTDGTSKGNTTANSYEKWKRKESRDTKVDSLMEQVHDLSNQLKQTEEDLKRANTKFNRERQLREEADKQVIHMREKGFAHHIDRRSAARSHAEDCLNTERLKLRNADLHEQYEILKSEAKKTLEKARDRVHEEKAAREAMEEQMIENRQHFEDALGREKEEHRMKMEELANKVKVAQEEISQFKTSATEKEQNLEDLQGKYSDYQQQVIEAKAEFKKEQTLRAELQAEMKAMEDELDSMERDLTQAREALQKAESNESKQRTTQETLEKTEKLYQEEHSQRVAKEKAMEDLRASAAEAGLTLLEEKEKVKLMEEDLREARKRCTTLEEELLEAEDRRARMKKLHQEQMKSCEHSADEKVQTLQKELKALESKCRTLQERYREEIESVGRSVDQKVISLEEERERLQRILEKERAQSTEQLRSLEKEHELVRGELHNLEEKFQREHHTKERSEERTFKQTQSIKKLTAELDKAKSHSEAAEKQCSELRKKLQVMASMTDEKLQEQVAALQQDLENSQDKCVTLQETLTQVELQLIRERDMRQAAESSLTMDERSLARRQREEDEQEQINMELGANFRAVRISEDKWRKEKKLRESAEEQCRSLREEIYCLKHEQVITSQNGNFRSDRHPDMEDRIATLKEELKLAESRRHVANESLEEERKWREDLEQQNQAFRDMIPEYAEAEERYQKERRLRTEAEAAVETLRTKLLGKKVWGKSENQDETTLATADTHTIAEMHQQVSEIKSELQSVRSQCEIAQASLHVAHEKYKHELNLREDVQSKLTVAEERYEIEHHLREDIQAQLSEAQKECEKEQQLREDVQSQFETLKSNARASSHLRSTSSGVSSSDEVHRRLREKAEKQLMSMRLKMEAKETEIASLKSRLSQGSSSSTSTAPSKTFSRRRRPLARPASDAGEKSSTPPTPPTVRELEYEMYRSSFPTNMTYDDDEANSRQVHSQEERELKDQIMETLPDYVKNNFGRTGFVKHSAFDYWPALVLDPFTVPLSIRTKWLELYYEFDKRDMFLVYLYGRRHRQDVNAYPIVEPHHFISYEEGIERSLDQLPVQIEDKLTYGDPLEEIEEELSDGLNQIRIDARQPPEARTHPLAEGSIIISPVPAPRHSMTSTTSASSASPRRPRSVYSKSG